MSPSRAPFGVFCLANDGVLEWFIALARSLRAVDPELPLTVIPYDDRLDGLRALQDELGFDVLDHPWVPELDAIGQGLWPDDPQGWRCLRKLAAFDGPYEDFVLLDSDVVVLEPLTPLLRAQAALPPAFWFFEEDRHEVYVPGPFRARMVAAGARGANMGAWGGRRGLLTPDVLRAAVPRAVAHREDFRDILEQTFVNFVLDDGGFDVIGYRDLVPGIAGSWAGSAFRREGPHLVERLHPTQSRTGYAPMLHWAGFPLSPRMPHFGLWLRHRVGEDRAARARYAARLWAPWLRTWAVDQARKRVRLRSRLRALAGR